MTDYKRMVSYMYQYENGIKKKNVGFVRVESKGGQCKITLHMQLLGQLDSIFPTYLIQRINNGVELIYLGDTVLKNQVMDSKLSADENDVMGTGFALTQMSGILLFLNDKVFFATVWDDKQIVAQEVLEALRPKKKRPDNKRREDMANVEKSPSETISQVNTVSLAKEFPSESSIQDEQLPEEYRLPKYMLPGGWKMVERLQWQAKAASEAAEVISDTKKEEGINNPFQYGELEFANIDFDIFHYDNKENQDILNQDIIDQDILDQDVINQDVLNQDIKQQPINEGLYQQNMFQNESPNNTGSDQYNENNSNQMMNNDLFGDILDNDSRDQLFKIIEELNAAEYDKELSVNPAQTGSTYQSDPQAAKRFFDNYPRIYPFEDNEIMQCVKIEPKDIGLLPKEIWPLSNNSFLLHGYYCYHHLIFAKMKNGFGYHFILGIPGIYHGREQFMARMFGFDHFKSIKKRELKQGDFGYWYLPLTL